MCSKVDGLPRAKCHYLARVLTMNNTDVVALQETYVVDYEQAARYEIHTYELIATMLQEELDKLP